MASYNPCNFNLGQFMNDLYQLPDLDAQFKFLGDQFEVINSYSLMLEKELQKVSALVATVQAPPVPGGLDSPPTSGTSKKVEVFANLGNFNGEINHFEKWWLKMKTWLNINQPTILPKPYDVVVAVLSCIKQKAGIFSTQRLEKGQTYTWSELEVDIVKQYHPTARPDWARQKLWKLKQGNTWSCNYVDLFTKYFKNAGISHSHAVTLDSGRGKRRLKDDKETKILKGLLQETCVLGASAAAPSNNRLRWRFKGFWQGAYTRE